MTNTFRDYVSLMRPTQWVKNVVIFAGPAAAKQIFQPEAVWHSLLAFASFCLASSATYAINDVKDRQADAKHPTKRSRPLARGAIQPGAALIFAAALLGGSFSITYWNLNLRVVGIIGAYFIITLCYSLFLKHRILIDVIVIASGFVLRAWAGAAAVPVQTSHWLVACMFTLCMFLGFGKRRCEVVMLSNEDDARAHRRTLVHYTPDLLNHLITVSAGIAIITFLLYTLDTRFTTPPFSKENMFYTLPLVFYGVFRYAMITELGIYTGPTEIILKDKGMRLCIALWAMAALIIVHYEDWMAWLNAFPPTAPAATSR